MQLSLTTLRTDQLHTWFLAIRAPQIGLPDFIHYFNDPFSWLLHLQNQASFLSCRLFSLLTVALFFQTTCCICMSLSSGLCHTHSILHLVKGSKRIRTRIDFPFTLQSDERSAKRRNIPIPLDCDGMVNVSEFGIRCRTDQNLGLRVFFFLIPLKSPKSWLSVADASLPFAVQLHHPTPAQRLACQ